MRLHRTLPFLLLFAAIAAAPAFASHDEVQFGETIVVPQGESIHDAVCFFCDVHDEGTVEGDIVVFFGNVHISSAARHDVVVFFGSIRAEDNATIAHDIVNFFGSARLGENVSVGGDLVEIFGSAHTANTATIGRDRVVQPAWVLFVPLMIFGGILALIVSAVRSHRRRQFYAAGYPFPPPPPPVQP